MCLIIKCNKDIPLTKPLLKNMLQKNEDGWGMMWIQNNAIQAHRSMETGDAVWEKYQELKEFNPVIHLRWRTHGDTDLANCHPFYCGHGIFLMHNGVISDTTTTNLSKSDTWHFIEDWVKSVFDLCKNPHETLRSKVFKKLLEKEVGINNRIIIGDRGGFITFNEASWHTVSNEKTNAVGLIVSNTYAWDAHNFGKPPIIYGPEQSHYLNYSTLAIHQLYHPSTPAYPHNSCPIIHIDGTVRNLLGEVLSHVVGNIYVDDLEKVWLYTHGVWRRCPDLDRNIQKRMKKQRKQAKKLGKLVPIGPPKDEAQAVLLLPPVTYQEQPTIIINEPNSNDEEAEIVTTYNKEEYTEILVRQWKQESKEAIYSLVYAEPDDAAKVLIALMGK